MSRTILQGGTINVSNESLLQLLLQGNIFQSEKKLQLTNLIQQMENGNKKLYQQFLTVIIELIKQPNQRKQIKQLAYDHITQLMVSANHVLINDLNNDLIRVIGEVYNDKDGLVDYVTLWKHMYNGKKDKQDFPNVSKTLQKITTPQSIKVTGKLAKFYAQFNKNLQKSKQKKVQFFEDFDDSSVSQSFVDDSQMTEIVYMDIMELKAIRQRVETLPLTEENCTEYLIKTKTFLNLKSTSLSGDLLNEFNKQKIWAKHFIDHHQDYLHRNTSQNQSITNKTNMLLNISLSKDEQSIQVPRSHFQKSKNKQRQQTFGYIQQVGNQQQQLLSRKKLQSEIQNFTINEVPIDQSRFTQRQSKNNLPVFNINNSLGDNNNFKSDRVIEKSQNFSNVNVDSNKNINDYLAMNIVNNATYQKMELHPQDKKLGIFQQVSRPHPQDTMPLEESILNNMSIPVQLATPAVMMMKKNPNNKVNNSPFPVAATKYNNTQNMIEYSSSKKDFSSTNNPFANSKTNCNPFPQSTIKTPYEVYKQNQPTIDIHSPIRNRMTEDDLDSDNIVDDLIVKPHYQKNLAFSNTDNNGQQVQYVATQYARTQLNFYDGGLTTNSKSQQKMFSQQLSPRSNTYDDTRSNKKRLSELTSQKKLRKNNALRQQSLNYPQEYAFRPYSVHFRKDLQNFCNFKRNCLQEKFPVYVSEQLVISCQLRKVKQSRVEVQIVYENQCREELSMRVLYKIPKSFKIEKVSKIHRKFNLVNMETHKFNLKVSEFPLQMCFLQLGYGLKSQQDSSIVLSAHIPLPITIKNFIETLVSSRQEWIKTYKKLTTESSQQPYIIEKTFEINREVVDPSALQDILGRQFMNIGASEGYSVEELGCICHYREINNIMFLLRIAIRVDHIATLSIITEHQLTNNQKDFLNYFMEILLTILAKYPI